MQTIKLVASNQPVRIAVVHIMRDNMIDDSLGLTGVACSCDSRSMADELAGIEAMRSAICSMSSLSPAP